MAHTPYIKNASLKRLGVYGLVSPTATKVESSASFSRFCIPASREKPAKISVILALS
jgi:hypothetical protein